MEVGELLPGERLDGAGEALGRPAVRMIDTEGQDAAQARRDGARIFLALLQAVDLPFLLALDL